MTSCASNLFAVIGSRPKKLFTNRNEDIATIEWNLIILAEGKLIIRKNYICEIKPRKLLRTHVIMSEASADQTFLSYNQTQWLSLISGSQPWQDMKMR